MGGDPLPFKYENTVKTSNFSENIAEIECTQLLCTVDNKVHKKKPQRNPKENRRMPKTIPKEEKKKNLRKNAYI